MGRTVTNQNCIGEDIKSRLYSGIACYHAVKYLLSSLPHQKTQPCRTVTLSVAFKDVKRVFHTEGRTQIEGVSEQGAGEYI